MKASDAGFQKAFGRMDRHDVDVPEDAYGVSQGYSINGTLYIAGQLPT
jgi:hypothetical protein